MTTTPKSTHSYGWKHDLPDFRDHVYMNMYLFLPLLPVRVDLRPMCPPVYDQGQLGSCTANAIAGALEFDQMKQNETPFITPARLFIYYNERAAEGTTESDAGAAIRDGIKSVNRQGACPETEWPYDINQFAVQPPQNCYADAVLHKAVSYQRLSQNVLVMKSCLASGSPFVFGFSVYDSFESDQVAATGIVPMPDRNENMLGGHAVLAVGYQEDKQCFIVRNSWGDQWGDKGYCYMPYQYLLDGGLASDFWTIRSVA